MVFGRVGDTSQATIRATGEGKGVTCYWRRRPCKNQQNKKYLERSMLLEPGRTHIPSTALNMNPCICKLKQYTPRNPMDEMLY